MSGLDTTATSYAASANATKEEGNDGTIPPKPLSNHPPRSMLSRFLLNFSRKTQLYLRFYAFFIIEAAFIALAAACLVSPIPLNTRFTFTDAEIKSGLIVIFVVWQNVAIFIGSCIAVDAFSREWSVQLVKVAREPNDGPPAIIPETIDRVSTISSGLFNRSLHLLDDKSSGTFKLAFLASLAFLALGSLGPGTMNATATVSTSIQIGRLPSQPQVDEFSAAQDRAGFIIELEMIGHSSFGYKLPPNMLAPVPRVGLPSFSETIEYDSDVVEFHHDCRWEAPQFSNISGSTVAIFAGQQWAGAAVGTGQDDVGSSVGSLFIMDLVLEGQIGSSAYLFSGGNSSVLDRRPKPPVPYAVDLTSLPTTFTAQGVGLGLNAFSVYAPLSSVLICDPHPQISGGRISITSDGVLTVLSSGKTPIGNISQRAANWVFAEALQVATVQLVLDGAANAVNDVASIIFMENSSTVNWDTAQGVRPLDLPLINQNMDTFMLSAAKAYIDGYRKNETGIAVEFESDTIPALAPEQRLSLTTSKPLFIATTVLVVMNTVLLLALCWSGLAPDRHPFDLRHVSEVLRGERLESEEL